MKKLIFVLLFLLLSSNLYAATFGYTSIGVDATGSFVDQIGGGMFEMSSGGDISKLTVYIDFQPAARRLPTFTIKCAIYEWDLVGGTHDYIDTTEERCANSTGSSGCFQYNDGWYDFNFSTDVSGIGGTEYLLTCWASSDDAPSDMDGVYDSEAGFTSHLKVETYGNWPDPLDGSDYNDNRLSIYATYTPSARRILMAQ